jgi:hypothetical protein
MKLQHFDPASSHPHLPQYPISRSLRFAGSGYERRWIITKSFEPSINICRMIFKVISWQADLGSDKCAGEFSD